MKTMMSSALLIVATMAISNAHADVQPEAIAALTTVVSAISVNPDNQARDVSGGDIMNEQNGGVNNRYDFCDVIVYGDNQIGIAAQVDESETPFRLSTHSIFNMGEKMEFYGTTFSKATLVSTRSLGPNDYQLNFRSGKSGTEDEIVQAESVQIRIKDKKMKSVSMKVSGFFSDKNITCAFK